MFFRSPRGILLLLVQEKYEEKDTPAIPALRAPLRCSPVVGRQKTRWRSDRFGVFFHHRLRCSAAPDGGQPVCAYLFQVYDRWKIILCISLQQHYQSDTCQLFTIPLVGILESFPQRERRVPAEIGYSAGIEQFARCSVRLVTIVSCFTIESNHFAD